MSDYDRRRDRDHRDYRDHREKDRDRTKHDEKSIKSKDVDYSSIKVDVKTNDSGEVECSVEETNKLR